METTDILTHRVLTPHGFGTCDMNSGRKILSVALERPLPGNGNILLDRTHSIFCFGRHALVRVLNLDRIGLCSSMQFSESKEWVSNAYLMEAPANETRILLDLKHGSVDFSPDITPENSFGNLLPWVDRFEREEGIFFPDEARARARFERNSIPVSGGIHSSLLIDFKSKKLLGLELMVAPPPGVFYRWKADDFKDDKD
jgi:hypothetical protein